MIGALIAAAKALAVVTIVAAILAGFAIISPRASVVFASVVAVLAAVAALRPFPIISRAADTLWLHSRTAVAVALVACVGIGFGAYMMIEQREAEFRAFRINHPKEYLAQLKAVNDPRWEPEFRLLDKPGYDSYLVELNAAQEQRRHTAIREWTAQLASVKANDLDGQVRIYFELAKLDPNNKTYETKWRELNDRLRKQEIAKEAAAKAAAKERLANNSEIRIAYAKQAEMNLLEEGMDFTVEANGDRRSTLYMRYVLMSRPMVYKFVTDQNFLTIVQGLGFKNVILSDGYNSVWRYRITETGFKQ